MKAILIIGLCILLATQAQAITVGSLTHEPSGRTSEIFSWTSDEPGDTTIDYGTSTDYGNNAQTTELTQSHQIELLALVPGTTYYYRAGSCTLAPDCSTVDGSFTALTISGLHEDNLSAVGVRISWETNRALVGKVLYGMYADTLTDVVSDGPSENHSISISGLTGDTSYYYRIYSGNASDGQGHSFHTSTDTNIAQVLLDSPIPSLTNNATVTVTGSTEPLSKLSVYINGDWAPTALSADGQQSYIYPVGPDGRFSFSFRLRNGQNRLVFEDTDADQNAVSVPFSAQIDTEGPKLEVDFPAASTSGEVSLLASTESEAHVKLFVDKNTGGCDDSCGTDAEPWCCPATNRRFATLGQCTAGCQLSADYEMDANGGAFNISIPGDLAEGDHNLTVTATDTAGNEEQARGRVRVDRTPPRITSVMVEDVLIGIGDKEHSQGDQNVVHFQVVKVKGNASEPAKVRIVNLGNSSKVRYNVTKKEFTDLSGNVYSLGVQGDPTDLFYDYDKTVQTDANGAFEAEVILLPGPNGFPGYNYIGIIAEDQAGLVNVRSDGTPTNIETVIFDGGSPFWALGKHSTSPNYIISGDLMKGDLPIALTVEISPMILDRSRLKVNGIEVQLPTGRYDNDKFLEGARPTMQWDDKTQKLYAYIPLRVKQWRGDDANRIPDPLTFEAKVSIHFTCTGCFQEQDIGGDQYIWVKEAVDIDRPIDYARFLTPNTIDKIVSGLHSLNGAIDSGIKFIRPFTYADMAACAIMVVVNSAKASIFHTMPDLEHMYLVCDRISCPKTPPNFDNALFSKTVMYKNGESSLPSNVGADRVTFKQGDTDTFDLWYTGEQGRCPTGMKEVKMSHTGPAKINLIGVPWQIPGQLGVDQNYLCTDKTTKADYFKDFDTLQQTLSQSKGFYYETNTQEITSQFGTPDFETNHDQSKLDYHQTKCIVNYFDAYGPEANHATIDNINPLEDIISSVQCGCLSGTQHNLEAMQKIFAEMEKCFLQAKQGDVTVGYCENILSMYVCDFSFSALKRIINLNDAGSGSVDASGKRTSSDAMSLITDGFKNRYPDNFGQQFGLGESSLVHKACQAAFTQDWSALEAGINTAIESVSVAPQVMPLLAESRVYTVDPFTGKLTIKYLFTPGVFSGGQGIDWELTKSCDKRGDNGDYCTQQVTEVKVQSGYISPGGQLTDFITDWDTDAEQWYNVAKLKLTYTLNGEVQTRIITGKITHLGQMLEQCSLTGALTGAAISCTHSGSGEGGLEFQDIRFTPGVDSPPTQRMTYYPGNDVNVLLKTRKINNFNDADVLLAYKPTGDSGDPYWVKISGNDLDDGIVRAFLFHVPLSIGSGNLVYRVTTDSGLATLNSLVQRKDVQLFAYSGNLQNPTLESISKVSWTRNGVVNTGVIIGSGTALDSLTIEVAAGTSEVMIYDGRMEQGGSYLFSMQRSATTFPFKTGQAISMDFWLYKDMDQDGTLSAADVPIPYDNAEQKKTLTFTFADKPKEGCVEQPRVELIYPLKNMICSGSFKAEATSWDDCNKEIVSFSLTTDGGQSQNIAGSKQLGATISAGEPIAISGQTLDLTATATVAPEGQTLAQSATQKISFMTGSNGDCTVMTTGQNSILNVQLQNQEQQYLNDVFVRPPTGPAEDPLMGNAIMSPHFLQIGGQRYQTFHQMIVSTSQELGVPPIVALAIAAKESGFRQCCQDAGHASSADCVATDETSCPLERVLHGPGGYSYGVMQINSNAHRACFDLSMDRSGSICNVAECNGFTPADLACNIAAGVNHLKTQQSPCQGAQCTCTNSAGKAYSDYTGWYRAIRAYNGWDCGSSDHDYVEEIVATAQQFKGATTESVFPQAKTLAQTGWFNNAEIAELQNNHAANDNYQKSYIVLHHTGGSDARGAIMGWVSSGLSAQYVVDKDGTVISVLPESSTAYHAGCTDPPKHCYDCTMNVKSIGIEIVNLGNGNDPYPQVQRDAVNNLVNYLANKYGIDRQNNIIGHGCIATDREPDEPKSFDVPSSWGWKLNHRGDVAICGPNAVPVLCTA